MIFQFVIPGQPPTGNLLYRQGRSGQVYKDRAISDYQLLVSHAAHRAMPGGWDPGHYDPKTGHGLIVVRYWFFLNRAVDADNAMKVINDGIKIGLGTRELYGKRGVRVVPRYDDERFLGQAWWLETGHRDDPRVEVAILTGWTGVGGVT